MNILVLTLPILTIVCGIAAIVSIVAGKSRQAQRDCLCDDAFDGPASSGVFGAIQQKVAHWLDDAELGFSPTAVLLTVVLTPVWCAICGFVFGFSADWMLGTVLVPPLAVVAALMLRRNQRRKVFDEMLPEAVSLLARSAHAGLSIDQSVAIAEETLTGRIAREFSLCRQQLQIGSSLGCAFRAMALRTRSPDVSFLATILSVHREAGGHLAETLDRLAAVLQDKLTMRRQLQASTSAGRFATKMLVPFAPVLFVLLSIVQPEHTAKFFASPLGWTVFLSGMVLELIGIAWVILLSQPE